MVTKLNFGTQFPTRRRGHDPTEMALEGLSSLDDRTYLISELHSAPHHYIKVTPKYFLRQVLWNTLALVGPKFFRAPALCRACAIICSHRKKSDDLLLMMKR